MSRTKDQKAPGLKWRPRRDGTSVAYWLARPDLIKKGYEPKSVRLHYSPGDPAIAERCHALQAEMLAWSEKESGEKRVAIYDGTLASLVRLYETHNDSPYHELEPSTQAAYSKTMAILMKHKGKRRVDKVIGLDVKRWYKEIRDTSSTGWAYYTINVLKAVLSFGATLRIDECRILREELRAARFNAGGRRQEQITYQQAASFRDTARSMGFDWIGRCLTLQFELALRRRDVIGEWIKDDGAQAGIRYGGLIWRDGLTWADIDGAGIIRRQISKTRKTSKVIAAHDIAIYPDLAADLARTPADQRIGPLVICHLTGVPPTPEQCRRFFRIVARKAGIPDEVWNMDARAGADTEAYEAGATTEETMALSTHTTVQNNRRYMRDLTEQSRRAAQKRVASRQILPENGK